jgi:hypothetical protein
LRSSPSARCSAMANNINHVMDVFSTKTFFVDHVLFCAI